MSDTVTFTNPRVMRLVGGILLAVGLLLAVAPMSASLGASYVRPDGIVLGGPVSCGSLVAQSGQNGSACAGAYGGRMILTGIVAIAGGALLVAGRRKKAVA